MYGTFNMGAGFAAYVKPADVSATLDAAQAAGVHAWLAGHAHHEGGRKAVVLEPLGISYEADTLAVK
jgi:phosphoribosylformylglycinamidine cyclo-ligase